MPQSAQLLLDAATCDRSRKMSEIPCQKIFDAAYGRDRNV